MALLNPIIPQYNPYINPRIPENLVHLNLIIPNLNPPIPEIQTLNPIIPHLNLCDFTCGCSRSQPPADAGRIV